MAIGEIVPVAQNLGWHFPYPKHVRAQAIAETFQGRRSINSKCGRRRLWIRLRSSHHPGIGGPPLDTLCTQTVFLSMAPAQVNSVSLASTAILIFFQEPIARRASAGWCAAIA
jgi:hypothetical protein